MLLAYGQTGSGKTYTITELEDLLVVEMIKVQARQVKLSIFEVAGNNVFGKYQFSRSTRDSDKRNRPSE